MDERALWRKGNASKWLPCHSRDLCTGTLAVPVWRERGPPAHSALREALRVMGNNWKSGTADLHGHGVGEGDAGAGAAAQAPRSREAHLQLPQVPAAIHAHQLCAATMRREPCASHVLSCQAAELSRIQTPSRRQWNGGTRRASRSLTGLCPSTHRQTPLCLDEAIHAHPRGKWCLKGRGHLQALVTDGLGGVAGGPCVGGGPTRGPQVHAPHVAARMTGKLPVHFWLSVQYTTVLAMCCKDRVSCRQLYA